MVRCAGGLELIDSSTRNSSGFSLARAACFVGLREAPRGDFREVNAGH